HPAEVRYAPVTVEVRSGEAEAAAPVGAGHGPGDGFPLRRFFGQQRGEYRRYSLVAVPEPDLVIPFVLAAEALPAPGDRMLRIALGDGHVVDRILRVRPLVIAANPLEELRAAFLFRNLDRVMQADQAHALQHQGAHGLEPIAGDQRMFGASVHV